MPNTADAARKMLQGTGQSAVAGVLSMATAEGAVVKDVHLDPAKGVAVPRLRATAEGYG